ncbi:glycosyltransferase [Chloroflexota bacterium]
MEKKNLVVIYLHFPPEPAISFPALILKYLVRLGWSVTVVTIEPGEKPKEVWQDWSGIQFLRITPEMNVLSTLSTRIHSKRYKDLQRLQVAAASDSGKHIRKSPYSGFGLLHAAINTMLNLFGEYHHFTPYVMRTLRKLHEKGPFSAVMSVYSGPFASHLVARQFAREAHLPWIAQVKDYWGSFAYSGFSEAPLVPRIFASIKCALRRHMEAKVLRDADILLPHCQPVADYLRRLVPKAHLRILPNCYDDDDFNEDLQPEVPDSDSIFTALWLGSTEVIQPLEMFFDALRKIHTSGAVRRDSFRVRFVGSEPDLIRAYAEAYSCSDLVEMIPFVSHKEAISYLKQATCLLISNRSGALARRLPEYVAARKPILLFPWDGTSTIQQVLEEYRAVFIARDSQEIATTLTEWYRASKAGRSISGPIQEGLVQSFKASKRALELQEILVHILTTNALNHRTIK